MSKENIESIERHAFYITEEIMPVCLFDQHLDESVRQHIATNIYWNAKWESQTLEKPKLPRKNQLEKNSLKDYMGPASSFLFQLFEIEDISFLLDPVKDWPSNKSYLLMKKYISNISPVNDSSERKVKLLQDFIMKSRDEKHRQDIMLQVNLSRKKLSCKNMTKSTLMDC